MFMASRLLLPLFIAGSTACAASAGDETPIFDVGIEMSGATDYMDTGLTNSDHKPSADITITPTYGIYYGTIAGQTIDYGADQPWLESKFAIGAIPTFDKLSVDFNLTRRVKFDDPAEDRWVPYATGTYTFSDNLSVSLGAGYYAYDEALDFWEFYGASTITFANSSYVTGELYWEPDQDASGNDYYAAYGTVGVPFLEKFEAIGTVGYEAYEDQDAVPSYLWTQAALKYNVTDQFSLLVGYQSNNLSSAECPLQAYTDCDNALFAKITYSFKLSDLFGKKEK